jgi:lipoprotein-anchoring transpeptidase ErfK/SrfK
MSPRARRRAGAAAAVVLALGAVAGCGADVEHPETTTGGQGSTPAGTLADHPQDQTTPAASPKPELKPPLAFHVRRRTQLRLGPDGKVVATITPHTGFRSPRILAVANRAPGWVLVRTSVTGHHVGWLPSSAGVLFSQPRTIVIDLSRRSLTVFHRDKLTDVYRVAVGAPGTETPRGKFAVTDRLRVRPGTPYGCCILALNGHQSKIAQGWGGGDRIAIHATPDTWVLGKAVSHGCIRGSSKTLRQLMRRIRLGTQVTIHQ